MAIMGWFDLPLRKQPTLSEFPPQAKLPSHQLLKLSKVSIWSLCFGYSSSNYRMGEEELID